MIQIVEELSMNAWPGLRTMVVDGWIVRFAKGYTRRANSVIPLYASKSNPAEKIEFCEKVYADQGGPAIFKMTAASEPQNLDGLLAERGYRAEATTSVQLLDGSRLEDRLDPQVQLTSEETEDWHTAFCRLNGIEPARQAIHQEIIHAIVPTKCFGSIQQNGQIIGCGLGVLQAGFMGLFDIVILKEYRQQKYGERLVQALLSWGKHNGAHTTYLQVMCNNAPALGLYAKLGFREAYPYWYRVKP